MVRAVHLCCKGLGACNHVQHPLGYAGSFSKLTKGKRSQRSVFRRLDDSCAANRESRANLARDHRSWEVPGGHHCTDTNWLLDSKCFPVIGGGRKHLPVHVSGH